MTPSPESSRTSEPGPAAETVGQGRYVVVGSLGAGSQAETLEAVDKREGRPVAIKRFTIRGAKSWKDVELAEREATVLAELDHPGLPKYIEHFEENGALYLVMEKIEGESLAVRKRRGGALNHEQIVRFLYDAAECLRYLHAQAPPIVHRDIKPGNVILRPDGSYCLVDFGSVRDRLKPEGGSTVVGTFGFMAPEQFQGRAAPGSDVYAVGATALSLVTGREPEDLPHKGLGIDVEGALRGQVDRRLIAALRVMLEPDPDRRASSIDAALKSAGLTQIGAASNARGASSAPNISTSAEATKKARRERIEAEMRARGSHRERIESEARERYHSREDRYKARVEWLAHKASQREVRRAERRARRYAEGDWRPGAPVPPLGMFLLLGLQLARIGTFALFQAFLPILFTLIVLPRTRKRMLQVGATGQRGIGRAEEFVRYKFLGGPIPEELRSLMDQPADGPFAPAASGEPPRTARQRVSGEAQAEELDSGVEETEPEKRARG